MKSAARVALVTLVVATAFSVFAVRSNSVAERPKPAEKSTSSIAEGHALLQTHDYEAALDAFLQAAAEPRTASEAIDGAVAALDGKTASYRLVPRLDAALRFQKQLPTGADRTVLRAHVRGYLLRPLIKQAQQARKLLKDRRAFVSDMRENDEGQVRSATIDGRPLTQAEARKAKLRFHDLAIAPAMTGLYDDAEQLAAAMDRFALDDQRYLQDVDVSDEALDDISDSCDRLEESLPPVERRLDAIAPGWRKLKL